MSALLCASRLRPPATLGPDRIVRLAGEAGFEGIAADVSMDRERLAALAATALRAGLSLAVADCPLAPTALGRGKRLPHLAAYEDPEERRAAVKLASATLAWGQEHGIPAFTIELGPVGLRSPEAELRLGYARREMDSDERGGRALRRALEERKARGNALFDACRAGLEPLLGTAERRGTRLLLRLAMTPWQMPTPREAHQLLREFSGSPLGLVYAPARRAVLEDLGLAGPPERWADLAAASALVELSDRVGLDVDYPLGVGQLALDLAAPPELPSGAAWLVTGPLDASFREVMRARRRADDLREAARARAAAGKAAESRPG